MAYSVRVSAAIYWFYDICFGFVPGVGKVLLYFGGTLMLFYFNIPSLLAHFLTEFSFNN
jgi:hypothetical protein